MVRAKALTIHISHKQMSVEKEREDYHYDKKSLLYRKISFPGFRD